MTAATGELGGGQHPDGDGHDERRGKRGTDERPATGRASIVKAGFVLDGGRGSRPEVARRDELGAAERTEFGAVGLVGGGRRPALATTRQVLVEPARLAGVEEALEPIRKIGPRASVARLPVVGPTAPRMQGHRAPRVGRSRAARASASASAWASASRSAASA